MDGDAVGYPRFFEKEFGGANDEVGRIDRKKRIVAREANARAFTAKDQMVVETDGVKDGLQLVEAIGAFPKNIQQQVDFAEGAFLKRCRHT
jgi:hypothetical protein